MKITDAMVLRFLNWKLPEDFRPDGGVTFTPPAGRNSHHAWPIGTNLLTDPQARAMLEHVLATEPEADAIADKERLDWLEGFHVEVRTPLVHGSRHLFRAHPDDNDGLETPSDIRREIDYQRKGGEKPKRLGGPSVP